MKITRVHRSARAPFIGLCFLVLIGGLVFLGACGDSKPVNSENEGGGAPTSSSTEINRLSPTLEAESATTIEAEIEIENPGLESNTDVPPTTTPSPLAVQGETPTPIDFSTAAVEVGTATPDTRLGPRQWRSWPVVPEIGASVKEIYFNGKTQGVNFEAFSTLGDCQSHPPVFMGIYATDRYWLGEGYEFLQDAIDHFGSTDSFFRQSYCVQNGLSVASALSPTWANTEDCLAEETPLDCEIRIHNPALMFINLGTNWTVNATASHDRYLRQIIDRLLERGIIPILSTKGDNIEGDWSINQSIAEIAYDYDIPLWNYWAAIQALPNHGLDPERPGGNYLTIDAWDRRSFTGLLVLERILSSIQTSN